MRNGDGCSGLHLHHEQWRRLHRAKTPHEIIRQIQDPGVNKKRALLRHYLLSLEFQLMIGILVLVNFCVGLTALLRDDWEKLDSLGVAAIVLYFTTLGTYTLQIVALAVVCGFRNYFKINFHWMHLLLIPTAWVFPFVKMSKSNAPGICAMFVNWLPLVEELLAPRFQILQALRHKVSMNKFRYIDYVENFDLDLTFIAQDLVAMSVPSTGKEALYRNPLREVARFFRTKLNGKFRIFNCCPELPYDDTLFVEAGGAVLRFNIQDHSPPTMNEFVEFLNHASAWKQGDAEKVITVHCKGGKGRTGSLCCAWLMYSQIVIGADSALQFFGKARTDFRQGSTVQGVETASQVRYIHQLFQHLQESDSWESSDKDVPRCQAPRVLLRSLDFVGGFFRDPVKVGKIKVLLQLGCPATGLKCAFESAPVDASTCSIDLGGIAVHGDVRLAVFKYPGHDFDAHAVASSAANLHKAKHILFCAVFHTGFLSSDREAFWSLAHMQDEAAPDPPPQTSPETDASGSSSFRIPVEHVDKAQTKPKKYTRGSSLVLRYAADPKDLTIDRYAADPKDLTIDRYAADPKDVTIDMTRVQKDLTIDMARVQKDNIDMLIVNSKGNTFTDI